MSESSRKASLLTVFLTVVVDLLGFGMVLPLIPVYAKQLTSGFSEAQAAWTLGGLMTIYSLMQLIFAPLWSRISDRVGRRPILILSLIGSTIFYALFGLATAWGSLWGMFLARLGGGIAGATIPTAQAYIADITPPEKRTQGMALIGLAFGLGFTFGPLLGALAELGSSAALNPWPGFLAAMLSATALSLAVFKLSESVRPETASSGRSHFDLTSLREAVSIPTIGALLGTLFLCNFGFASFEGTLSLSLDEFLGVDRRYQIALAFAYVGLIQTLVQGGLVRWMAAFTSEAVLSAIGTVLCLVGYVLLAVAADPHLGGPVALMLAGSVVIAGLGFIYPSIMALISRRSDPANQGGILGIGSTTTTLARIGGMHLAMQLHYHLGHSMPFLAAAALMTVVVFLVALATRRGGDWQPAVAQA